MGVKKEVVKLSFTFFLLFTADTSYSAIINYIFEKRQLPAIGSESLFTQYLTFAISLLLTPSIPLKLKTKIILGCALTTFSYFLSIIAVLSGQSTLIFWLLVSGSGINGISAGLLWVSQGRYMHLICQIFNVGEERGRVFGIFQFFYCMAMLCGALVTFLGEGYFDDTIYLCFLVGFGLSSFLFGLLFLTDITVISQNENQSVQECERRTEQLQVIMLKIKEQEEATNYKLSQFIAGFLQFLPTMLCLLPVYLSEAITTGTRLNQLTHLIPSSLDVQARNKAAGIIQIVSGGGSILGGYTTSFMTDIIGTLWVGRIILILFSLICWFHIGVSLQPNIVLAYIMSFFWGFLLFSFVGLLLIIISRHYEGRAEAFSINRLALSIFMMCFQGAMIVTDNQLPWKAYIGFSVIPIVAIFYLGRLPPSIQNS